MDSNIFILVSYYGIISIIFSGLRIGKKHETRRILIYIKQEKRLNSFVLIKTKRFPTTVSGRGEDGYIKRKLYYIRELVTKSQKAQNVKQCTI